MRPWLPVPLVLATVAGGCASPRPARAPAPAPAAAPAEAAEAVLPPASAASADSPASSRTQFDASVKPILVSKCMPCHFPGGKMYARMPFDDPAVVASHSEGVLRRIKDPEERQAFETWRAQAQE